MQGARRSLLMLCCSGVTSCGEVQLPWTAVMQHMSYTMLGQPSSRQAVSGKQHALSSFSTCSSCCSSSSSSSSSSSGLDSSSSSSSSDCGSRKVMLSQKRRKGYESQLPKERKYGPQLRDIDPAAFEQMRLVLGYYDLPENRSKPRPPLPTHVTINNMQTLKFTKDVDPYYKLALLSYRSKLENAHIAQTLGRTRSFLLQLSVAALDFVPADIESLVSAGAITAAQTQTQTQTQTQQQGEGEGEGQQVRQPESESLVAGETTAAQTQMQQGEGQQVKQPESQEE